MASFKQHAEPPGILLCGVNGNNTVLTSYTTTALVTMDSIDRQAVSWLSTNQLLLM